jgi:hypothetical protein
MEKTEDERTREADREAINELAKVLTANRMTWPEKLDNEHLGLGVLLDVGARLMDLTRAGWTHRKPGAFRKAAIKVAAIALRIAVDCQGDGWGEDGMPE